MKTLFAKARWKWLRLLLVVLLPLHAGFAQAAMSAAPASHAQAVAALDHGMNMDDGMSMADGMPCHDTAKSAPVSDHSTHKDGCCDAGSCHCALACGLGFTVVRLVSQTGLAAPPFSYLSAPAAARPPDLRPPIR